MVRDTGRYGELETDVLSIDEWHHVTLVFVNNDGSRKFLVYHDNESKGTEDIDDYRSSGSASGNVVIGDKHVDRSPWTIGQSTTTPSGDYIPPGSITVDELAMWNKALSASQVGQIYNMLS